MRPEKAEVRIPWNRLSNKSLTTLRWTMSRANVPFEPYMQGFTFEMLALLTMQDLRDAKNVGEKRAQELLNELEVIFQNLESKEGGKDEELQNQSVLEVALDSSMALLAYISVEENLGDYQARISRNAPKLAKSIEVEISHLNAGKISFWNRMTRNTDRDENLSRILKSQLRIPFSVARNGFHELDLRTKILAGNLGLVAAIKTFDHKKHQLFNDYAINLIEEFIENLVLAGGVDYPALESMLLSSDISVLETNSDSNPLLSQVMNASTVGDLVSLLELVLQTSPKFDYRIFGILKERLPIFTSTPRTLEAIAKDWGVTRERIRQITAKWANFTYPVQSEISALSNAVALLGISESEDDFYERQNIEDASQEIVLTSARLFALCKFFGQDRLKAQVEEGIAAWDLIQSVDNDLKRDVKKLRSAMGLYDLALLEEKFKISRQEAISAIESNYPRNIIKGDLVLARTKHLDSMFENSIAKQLQVADGLNSAELIIGLERTASNRGVSLIGNNNDLALVIDELAGVDHTYACISSKLIKQVELQRVETWLVEVFSDNDSNVFHSNELVAKALRDEINVSSLQVYLVNSPIVRALGNGMYTLVGKRVDDEKLEIHRKMILSTGKVSEVSFDISSSGIRLSVSPNINVITSGIIFPPSGLRKMVEGYTFETTCMCEGLVSKQMVKFSPSGFWTGFTSMIRHGIAEHQMNIDSEFVFNFNFDTKKVALEI